VDYVAWGMRHNAEMGGAESTRQMTTICDNGMAGAGPQAAADYVAWSMRHNTEKRGAESA